MKAAVFLGMLFLAGLAMTFPYRSATLTCNTTIGDSSSPALSPGNLFNVESCDHRISVWLGPEPPEVHVVAVKLKWTVQRSLLDDALAWARQEVTR